MKLPPLAFVDVETTGVDPRTDRITEVGVVTVDGARVEEWSSVINPLKRRQERAAAPHEITDSMRDDAPRFKDIATDLARRLEGRLLVAHNARFDHGFLKTEFDRAGIDFAPKVLCSLMLSRRLYKELAHHDLDSLMATHALTAPVRHRAVHDANVVWQFWRHIHRALPPATVVGAIQSLLEGPLLPGHLDPSLIDRLPDAPGVYFLHGEDDEILLAATAGNLKSRVQSYFRLDLISRRALGISHRIRNVTWRVTQGPLGARLQLALSPQPPSSGRKKNAPGALHSYRFEPDAAPCLTLVGLGSRSLREGNDLFGAFETPRKAQNALRRIAARHRLCHSIIGLPEASCEACAGRHDDPVSRCAHGTGRLAQLTRAFSGLRGLRVPAWPYEGPIGIRERRDVYVFDQWQYLGTARNSSEIYDALETRTPEFDVRVFRLLVKTLRRLPPQRIVPLASSPGKRVSPTCAVLSSS